MKNQRKNILIYGISYKILIGSKPLRIRFNKIDGFIKEHCYSTLFGPKRYDAIYNRIRYLISLRSSITYMFSHYYAKRKAHSCDSLPIEKILILHVIIFIKSVLNKDKNHYYYKIFLEKCS